ncbi:hypothetical protein OH76DRAFT_835333 [Lentinus brumalis]|uniref:F-box domain-containing protein n=1 Tax=Lentinus brumalis TaxID=2498619 RepID=A0A371D224_9APHY|nr:hypothetical protein OH76DRAFT_835333 [Polyporus brumalis]
MNLYEHAELFAQKAERADQERDVGVEELHKILSLLEASERSIRTAINARAAIHRILPPELIVAIFAFVPTPAYRSTDSLQGACGPYLLSDTAELLAVTLVCKLWRSLALDMSTIWSSISCGDPVNRSSAFGGSYRLPIHFSRIPASCIGAVPLYVHAEAPDIWPHASRTSAFLSNHGHLIEELHIRLHANARQFNTFQLAGADEEPLPPSLTFSATSLRRLAIHGLGRSDERRDVTRALFGGITLNLSSLMMWNTPFLPSNAMGSSLTRLLLSRSDSHDNQDQGLIPIRSLLRFLAVSRYLEQAYLQGIAVCEEDLQTFPTAYLPRVRKMAIAVGLGAAQLLSRLRLSEACLLELDGDVRSPEDNRALRSVIAGLGWGGTKAHVVWEGGWNGSGSAGFSSLQVINRSAGGLRIDLSSRRAGTNHEVAQAIRLFLSTSPFVTAEEVWLSGTKVAELLSDSARIISPLSALKTLHILNLKSLDIQHAGILWPDMTSQEIGLDNLPNLTCLHYCLPHDQYLFDLVPLLSARARANHPLTSLFISVRPVPRDSSSMTMAEHDNAASVIRGVTQILVGGEVEVGEALYDRPGFAWWSVVPRECTAADEVHAHWPVWAEGIANTFGSEHRGTLSGRLDVAFGRGETYPRGRGVGGGPFG